MIFIGFPYRHAIFIFLTNTGGNAIVERTFELWKDGKKRNDFQLTDFENVLTLEAFNEKGIFF